ncbi:MAG: hypothetical protein EOP53_03885 [Sphingobacteriales bacterium]|nr:MAG: hypothetical protein EOP53_03885 [Sphingobacteriales bacterium]
MIINLVCAWITIDDKPTFIFGVLNALGSIATFLTFLFLLRKDKDKQNQINRLTNIASNLDAQTEVMRQQNDLIAQQVDIFRNRSLFDSKDNDALKKLHEIEEKKLKLSVKPNLWLNGVSTHGTTGEIKFDLNNKGETAFLTEMNLINGDISLHDLHIPYELEKGQRRYIFGRNASEKHILQCSYEIEILYTDSLKNQYKSIIKGTGPRAKLENLDS